MATPDIQNNPIDSVNLPEDAVANPDPAHQTGTSTSGPRRNDHWLDRIFYVSAAIAGVGFLVVLFAAYVTPSLVAILVGTALITLGVIAWIFTALILIVVVLKSLFSRGASSRRPR